MKNLIGALIMIGDSFVIIPLDIDKLSVVFTIILFYCFHLFHQVFSKIQLLHSLETKFPKGMMEDCSMIFKFGEME